MASLAQKIYWRIPYLAKCWMASINECRGAPWRYGEVYERSAPGIVECANWPAVASLRSASTTAAAGTLPMTMVPPDSKPDSVQRMGTS